MFVCTVSRQSFASFLAYFFAEGYFYLCDDCLLCFALSLSLFLCKQQHSARVCVCLCVVSTYDEQTQDRSFPVGFHRAQRKRNPKKCGSKNELRKKLSHFTREWAQKKGNEKNFHNKKTKPYKSHPQHHVFLFVR